MSRALGTLILAALLAACQIAPSRAPQPPPAPRSDPVEQWLQLQAQVRELDEEQLVAALVDIDRPQDSDQLYYYGLLNQQLRSLGAWVQARDSFKTLADTAVLSRQQQQLLQMQLEFNQARINWYMRNQELAGEHDALQGRLEETEAERQLLEEKIQALTDLEAVISTRKEE
tara:strand:- start:1740 stop:2255 length:516 start_codon:yes stop_codon:yes gene_type:complete